MSYKKPKPKKERYSGQPAVSELKTDGNDAKCASFLVKASKKTIQRLAYQLSKNTNVAALKKKTSFIVEIYIDRPNDAEILRTSVMAYIFWIQMFLGKIKKYQGMKVDEAISDYFSIPGNSITEAYAIAPKQHQEKLSEIPR